MIGEKILFEVIVEAVIRSITASLPFLNWPVINPIFRLILTKISEKLYEELSFQVNFQFIGYRTDEELREYEQAKRMLTFDPQNKALQNAFRDNLRKLIHVELPTGQS